MKNAVYQQCEAILRVPRAVDAANIDLRITRFHVIDHGDARRQLDKPFSATDTSAFDHIRRYCRDRTRNILQAF